MDAKELAKLIEYLENAITECKLNSANIPKDDISLAEYQFIRGELAAYIAVLNSIQNGVYK